MPETSLHEKLQPHVGRIVKVICGGLYCEHVGKLGILLEASSAGMLSVGAWVNLLIDGKIRLLYVHSGDLELIGAEAGER
jgi:hypothetical protein